MDRPRASIVILGWNEWARTRECLDTLRPTLRPGDEIIVVDNGSTDFTPKGLRSYGWVRTITNEENQGFAAGCNQGAAAATQDVVVFLNNDTVLAGQWLDRLLLPFADPTVGATGPRSNFVSGPQLIDDVGYDESDRRGMRTFARRWADERRGEISEVTRLVGFCLAVRRSAFEQVGGFHEGYGLGGYEDDDLCSSLRAAGHRLLVVHDSFVHHVGHATFTGNGIDWFALQQENQAVYAQRHLAPREEGPLLSACLIVKDEEAFIVDCLASIADVVDEIVVYDTGSTDATVELCEAAGARVIRGYWDDDFGRARNAALAECRGTWALQVDADERLTGDVTGLRRLLASTDKDALLLTIENEAVDGAVALSHTALRVFRRERARWTGRLHEHIIERDSQPALRGDHLDQPVIRHLGYRADVARDRDKATRNVAIAEAELRAGSRDRATLLINMARSFQMAGRLDEALARCEEAVRTAGRRNALLMARVTKVEVLLALRRAEDAFVAIDELAADGEREDACELLRDRARMLQGDLDATARVAFCDDLINAGGWGVASDHVRAVALVALAEGLGAAGRWDEAGAALLESARRNPGRPVWGMLAAAAGHGGVDAAAVAEVATDDVLRSVLAHLLSAGHDDGADAVGEALHDRWPGDPRVLGFAVHLAPRLTVERALDWAIRIRSAGMAASCPLVAIASDGARPATEQLRAVAVLEGAFTDSRARTLLPAVARSLPEDAFLGALVEVDELAPSLLPALVEGCATRADRASTLANALRTLGAVEQADLLVDFAESLKPVG